ncbi:AP-4 complex subunit mu-1-like isoform X1 [Ruditapes philippinarum]|uniref:AP-4 complex subunit mu-1-like isoform X1 n=2 Tax=Ruditapes philippinarum TaxID=129788 RepID=UPI00295B53D1|nr:AP-4 complex subunit mu-1-like isoform X1 [Ruditapes philippinarum]
MISKLFIVSKAGELLIEKDYRYEFSVSPEMYFLEKLKASRASSIQPHFYLNGISFFNIQRNDVYLVACSASSLLPVMVIELLTRLYHICKDFCGVVNEHSVKENVLLLYELLDDFMNEGYVQLASTEKLRPYIQSAPVVVQKERSPATEISSRVFGIETKTISGSASSKPVVQSGSEQNKNELYVDVIERISALIAVDGTVSQMEVNGSVNIKNFLVGSPQVKIVLNEELVVSNSNIKGYGSNVQLDRCTFHSCVKQEDFTTSKTLTFVPPVGEISVLSYSISGEMCLNQPFSLRSFVGDAEGSRDVRVTLRLKSNFPTNITAVNVKVKFSLPKAVASISSKLSDDEQTAIIDKAEKQVVWTLKRIPGKTESIAEFRLINQGSGRLSQQEIDPLVLEFEISGYTSSGLAVRALKLQGTDKSQPRRHFVRLITASDSYVFRTF